MTSTMKRRYFTCLDCNRKCAMVGTPEEKLRFAFGSILTGFTHASQGKACPTTATKADKARAGREARAMKHG